MDTVEVAMLVHTLILVLTMAGTLWLLGRRKRPRPPGMWTTALVLVGLFLVFVALYRAVFRGSSGPL